MILKVNFSYFLKGTCNKWKIVMIVQLADTVIYISPTWMILKYPCRSACVMVKITRKNNRKEKMYG